MRRLPTAWYSLKRGHSSFSARTRSRNAGAPRPASPCSASPSCCRPSASPRGDDVAADSTDDEQKGLRDFPKSLRSGAEGARTPSLRIANAALSQLSYGPKSLIIRHLHPRNDRDDLFPIEFRRHVNRGIIEAGCAGRQGDLPPGLFATQLPAPGDFSATALRWYSSPPNCFSSLSWSRHSLARTLSWRTSTNSFDRWYSARDSSSRSWL